MALAAPAAAHAEAVPAPLTLAGRAAQSGMMTGRTAPDARVWIDDVESRADAAGVFVFGFDRDAALSARVQVLTPDGRRADQTVAVAPRAFPVRAVNGLPPAMVNPPAEAQARIARDAALKQRAFASLADAAGFLERWRWPLDHVRVTSPWGAQRVLNGAAQRPHYGVDLAAPIGAPVCAPAGGVVCVAEPDLYFEGGLVGVDHGQGLISLYLHLSAIDVAAGRRVAQGDRLGAVGARGRATGPHLCWRLRWRGRQLDPGLLTA